MFENKVKLNWPPPFQADDIRISILGSGINLTLCLYQLGNLRSFLLVPLTPYHMSPLWLLFMDLLMITRWFGRQSFFKTWTLKVIRWLFQWDLSIYGRYKFKKWLMEKSQRQLCLLVIQVLRCTWMEFAMGGEIHMIGHIWHHLTWVMRRYLQRPYPKICMIVLNGSFEWVEWYL